MARCNTHISADLLAQDCASWPAEARARWLEAFDPISGSHDWSREAQYTYARVFTRYLAITAELGLSTAPVAISPTGLRAFLEEAEKTATLRTIYGYVHQLLEVATVVYPEALKAGHLDWLVKTRRRLELRAKRTQKQRHRQVVPVEDLFRVALSAMREGEDEDDFVRFRTGVFLLLLIYAPERRRAMAGLDLSMIEWASGLITWPAHLQKSKTEVTRVVPREVLGVLQDYIENWRSRYADPAEDAVFITTTGRRLSGEALRAAMVKLTTEKLGVAVPPHLVRHVTASMVVEHDPELARLAQAYLGHSSAEMTKEYAEAARGHRASRRAQDYLRRSRVAAGQAILFPRTELSGEWRAELPAPPPGGSAGSP